MAQQEKKQETEQQNPKVSPLKSSLDMGDIFEKGKQAASDIAHQAQDYTQEMTTKAQDVVKQHPLQALLVGFSLGFIVGLVSTRK